MENKHSCAQDDIGPINSSTVYVHNIAAVQKKTHKKKGVYYGSKVVLIYLHRSCLVMLHQSK